MEWLSWVLLGLVQGLTEFLPVSSSGHLVLGQVLLGLEAPGVLLEVTVHAATAAAVVTLFAREIASMAAAVLRWPLGPGRALEGDAAWRRLAWNLFVATAATSVMGFGLEPVFRGAFETPVVAAVMLLVTGTVLFLTVRLARGRLDLHDIRASDAVLVGVFQGLAILPGLSRSGMTIVGGLTRGLSGEASARFSFLLSLPAIAGATLVEVFRSLGTYGPAPGGLPLSGLALAFAAAFTSGLGAMVLLIRIVRRGGLHRFAWYCWAVGAAALIWLLGS